MNQELILKAVKAVMDFNESQGDDLTYFASVQVSRLHLWLFIHEPDSAEILFNNHDANNEAINEFIEKLNELKGE